MTSILKDTDNSGSSLIQLSPDIQNIQSFTNYMSRIWLLCSDYSCKSPQNKVKFVEYERSPLSFGQFIKQRMLFCPETHLLHLPQVLLKSMTIIPEVKEQTVPIVFMNHDGKKWAVYTTIASSNTQTRAKALSPSAAAGTIKRMMHETAEHCSILRSVSNSEECWKISPEDKYLKNRFRKFSAKNSTRISWKDLLADTNL